MKVDLKTEIKDEKNEVIFLDETKREALTLSHVIVVALQTPLKGDEEDSGEQRIKKFNIMKSMHTSKDSKIDIESADVAMIKERVLKIYPTPVVYGRVCEIFGDKK